MKNKLKEFWDVLDLVKDPRGHINEHGYTELNIRFQQALHPPHTVDEALVGAREDWARDCSDGTGGLGFEKFVHSVIELVVRLCIVGFRRHASM